MGELADLQVDHEQAPPAAMEEQEVDPVPRVADPQPLLPPDEREVTSKLQQEVFQLVDERLPDGITRAGSSDFADGVCKMWG